MELSLQARADVERERKQLEKHWRQRRQRARYDVELAERRYQAVDPANRLVAASLERRWEEALEEERKLQEEYDRFVPHTPSQLTDEERTRIMALTTNMPALWHAAGTTNADRKQIIRCLTEKVVVDVLVRQRVRGLPPLGRRLRKPPRDHSSGGHLRPTPRLRITDEAHSRTASDGKQPRRSPRHSIAKGSTHPNVGVCLRPRSCINCSSAAV